MKSEISKIQYITRDSLKYSHAEQALLMYKNGIKWVQLRMKNSSGNEITRQAKKALEYAQNHNAVLILNDSVEICKNIGAHGVHLGLMDMPAQHARKLLGANAIIGGTANTIDDINLQISRGVDYVGVGPFRFTTTKKNLSPVIGLNGYRNISNTIQESRVDTPLIAVGGILMEDLDDILASGMHGVAISEALLKKYGELN